MAYVARNLPLTVTLFIYPNGVIVQGQACNSRRFIRVRQTICVKISGEDNFIPCKDIGAEDASDDVAEVGDIVDVGEGGGHQDIAGAIPRTSWPLKSESFLYNLKILT